MGEFNVPILPQKNARGKVLHEIGKKVHVLSPGTSSYVPFDPAADLVLAANDGVVSFDLRSKVAGLFFKLRSCPLRTSGTSPSMNCSEHSIAP
jgi:hypothetical protein